MSPELALILDKERMGQCIGELAGKIRDACPGPELALVGIHRRGVPLAERIYHLLKPHYSQLHIGRVDISLYRDDIQSLGVMPKLVGSDIGFDLEDQHVILCDEVFYTGRTARAALEELLDFGRARKVELAVLVDRGGRELPLAAQYIGLEIATGPEQRVQVHFDEVDGEDAVYVQGGQNS